MKIKSFRDKTITTNRYYGYAIWIHGGDGKVQDKRYRNIHLIRLKDGIVKFTSFMHKRTAKRKLGKMKQIEYTRESIKNPFITSHKDAYKKKANKKSIWSWARNI